VYEEPLVPVLDALTLASLGGGAAAKMGRLSGISNLEKAGVALGGLPARLGQKVVESPYRAFNLVAPRFGLDKVNPKLLKELRDYDRTASTWGNAAKQKLINDRFDKQAGILSDQQLEKLDSFANDVGNTVAGLVQDPAIHAAYNTYRRAIVKLKEISIGPKGRALLTEDQMHNAVIKKLADRYKITTEEAQILWDKSELKPIYTPSIHVPTKEIGIFDIRNPQEYKSGNIKFLNRFKGGGDYNTNPKFYMKKAMEAWLDVETELKFIDQIKQSPNLVKAAQAGDINFKDILPKGIHQKYYPDKAHAQAVAMRELKEKAGSINVYKALMEQPETMKYVKSIKDIAAKDPTVANYLKWKFTRASGRLAKFLRAYDKTIGLFRLSATVLNPRWYTGNAVGDAYLMVLANEYGLAWPMIDRMLSYFPPQLKAGGRYMGAETGAAGRWMGKLEPIANISQIFDDLARRSIYFREVAQAFKKSYNTFAASGKSLEEFAQTVGMSTENLLRLQSKIQVLDEHIARSIPEIVRLDNQIAKLERQAARVTDSSIRWKIQNKANSKSAFRDEKVADYRDQLNQSGEMQVMIPELKQYEAISEAALLRANTFLGDYWGMGPMERAVFRRLVPFYAWTKAMGKLAYTLPFIAPKTAFFWHRYAQTMVEMAGDQDIPPWMSGYFPTHVNKDGDSLWIKLTGLSPFGSNRLARFGQAPVPSLLTFWESNPILKVIYKLSGGKDEFSWAGKPPDGEMWVSNYDGRITRFQDGKLVTEVPQPPMISTLAHTFPVVQMLDQLVTPYELNKGEQFNPDGTPKYPLEMWQRLWNTFGVKTKMANAEDLKLQEKRMVLKKVLELKSLYKRASPQQKVYIQGIIQDYVNGHYREFQEYD